MKRKKGFTLVELLVVIAVIALLMSILMPVLRKARDQAMRIMCGNHIKNLQLGVLMYADNNANKIFSLRGGAWPWDVPSSVVQSELRYMGTDMASLRVRDTRDIPLSYSENFYCPANTPQKRAREASFYYAGGGYSVTSFFYTWSAPWNGQGDNVSNNNCIIGYGKGIIGDALKKDPAKIWVTRVDVPQASSRELILDATISQLQNYDSTKYPMGNFSMVTVGGNPSNGIPDSTNHAISDQKVSGGNIGFVDGHVEWRPWTEMRLRFITYNNNPQGDPHWWW